MSFQDDLNKLLGSSNPYAQLLGQKVKNINDALEAKTISADEAKDLLNDINVATQIANLAQDLENQILAQKVIDGLIYIIENISSI